MRATPPAPTAPAAAPLPPPPQAFDEQLLQLTTRVEVNEDLQREQAGSMGRLEEAMAGLQGSLESTMECIARMRSSSRAA